MQQGGATADHTGAWGLILPDSEQLRRVGAGLSAGWQGNPSGACVLLNESRGTCPQDPTASEETSMCVHILDGITAGIDVTGLSFVAVNQNGQVAGQGLRGKTVTSWSTGCKKLTFPDDGSLLPLPVLKVGARGPSPGWSCQPAPRFAACPQGCLAGQQPAPRCCWLLQPCTRCRCR